MDTVQVGDVLQDKNGTYRVVREVTRYPPARPDYPPRIWVTFAIRRCSQYNHCVTSMCCSMLYGRGFRPTRMRVKLDQPIDAQIARAIAALKYEDGWASSRIADCCDVKGIA
jgi:hypothetical protein